MRTHSRLFPLLLATIGLLLMLAACLPAYRPDTPPAPQMPVDRMLSLIPGDRQILPEDDPLPPILHHDGWQTPVPVLGAVNTPGLEDSAFITPDGQQLYFFFTPTIANPPEGQLVDGVTGIYLSRWEGSAWGPAERIMLNEPGELSLDGCLTVVGDQAWFCSAREGNRRDLDIWRGFYIEGKWGQWENAGDLLNLEYQVGELHLSADGTLLIYHTAALPGQGGKDIWQTLLVDGVWQLPEPIAAVNTPSDEGWPFLSQDGQELWFTRFHQGSPAIFRSLWGPEGWGQPELIVSQFAGEPSLDAAGNLYFTHHILIDGVIEEADIYVAFKLP